LCGLLFVVLYVLCFRLLFFFFKQKTAYEIVDCDWSSDVCSSDLCETFFNDARADKSDLLGDLNDGWSVVKRLLQHERQSQTSAPAAVKIDQEPLQEQAKRYVGTMEDGTLADPDLRLRVVENLMDAEAHKLTVSRITAEAKGQVKVSAAASILKNSMTRVAQTKAELTLEMMGNQGIGWEGEQFSEEELRSGGAGRRGEERRATRVCILRAG